MRSGPTVASLEIKFGFVVERSMEMSIKCMVTVKKADPISGIIKKEIENKTVGTVISVYNSTIWPHLDSFYNSDLKTSTAEMEKHRKGQPK